LPEGASDLQVVRDTNSVSSMASSTCFPALMLILAQGDFKLSRDVCNELMILGLITIVVQGLLSFHHLVKPEQLLLHLQQQQ
jgi:hypothetical protein